MTQPTPNFPVTRVGQALIPLGDMGLGLCLQCLGRVIGDPENAPQPRFAITLYPMPHAAGGVAALVAVPACWECLSSAGEQANRKPLLVAGGMG